MPIRISDICPSSLQHFYGLGIPISAERYGDVGKHFGVDIFTQSTSANVITVHAIEAGLVVGIGEGRPKPIDNDRNQVSAHTWGSAVLGTGTGGYRPGYSVIVRTGHLYVLYGHLQALDDSIYVGTRVQPGQVLGQLGQFNSDHVHIEVRNVYEITNFNGDPIFGDLNKTLLNTGLNSRNEGVLNRFGILDYQPSNAGWFVYDLIQFYPDGVVYNPDNDGNPNNDIQIDSIFGRDVITGILTGTLDGTSVYISEPLFSSLADPFNTEDCVRRDSVSTLIYDNSLGSANVNSGGYWGFQLISGGSSLNLESPFVNGPQIPR